ncbi:MAG: glycoside hydrolase family 5 protein [Spirochaetes bacterium]|nr:glycoside hydrolase family 5 protein [Spirochaetota bacterium]
MTTELLKGVNLGGWFSQIDAISEKDPDIFPGIDIHMKTFISQADISRIANAGFNHVRLPLDYQNFFSSDGELLFNDRLDTVEGAVKNFINSGLKVMLDLHECPGHDFDEALRSEQGFFTDKRQRQATKNIWTELCRRFGNNSSIYLELLNEPVAPTDEIWNETKKELSDFVREISPDSTIILGSNKWNAPSTFENLSLIDDENILYCFHFYSPLLFTHQKAGWLDDPNSKIARPYPGNYSIDENTLKVKRLGEETGIWDRNRLTQEIEPVLRFRDKYKVPVVCNEFGVFHQAPRESQLRWMDDFISILKEHGIGFTYWNYKNLDFGLVSIGERLHEKLPQFSNRDRLDTELMNLLAGY